MYSLQDYLPWARVSSSLVASHSLVTYLPQMSEFQTSTYQFLYFHRQLCLMRFFYCLQKHCGACLKKPHSLYISTVLWRRSGMLLLTEQILSFFLHWEFVTYWSVYACFQCVCIGIFIGSGVQKIVALSNLVCYYCIALPVGIALMFAAKLRILGNVLITLNPSVSSNKMKVLLLLWSHTLLFYFQSRSEHVHNAW